VKIAKRASFERASALIRLMINVITALAPVMLQQRE
jgi:hypothetical protein